MISTYYRMLVEEEVPEAVGKMKQFATYFSHGCRNGTKLRTQIYQAREATVIREIVDAFFDRELAAA